MRYLWFVGLTAFCAVISTAAPYAAEAQAQAQAASEATLPFEPRVERLPNGLTVVSIPWPSPGIIAYYTLVRTGAMDEVEPGHSGFAHLFEHMMFRGTERVPEAEYERRLQAFGADNNAYTTQDFTLYHTTGPVESLPELVDIEADRFQRLHYSEEQFRTETGAVLGEYNKNSSSPFLKMWEALSEMAFSRHTYGHTTMGYLRDVQTMPEKFEYSQRFLRRYYTPDNCVVIVAGDVEHAPLMDLVRDRYGEWRGRRDRPRIPREPEPRQGGTRHIEWEGSSPPRMFIGYRAPSFDGEQRRGRRRQAALRETAALQVVHALAFHESSPLYQRLVVEEQRLLELGSWAGEMTRDAHLFPITAMLKPGTEFAPVIEAIQAELSSIGEGSVEADRIAKVKSHVRYALLMGLETPDDVADLVARFMAVGDGLDALTDYLAELEAVTPADVARVSRQYLTESRRFIVTLAPRQADEGSPAEASEGGVQ